MSHILEEELHAYLDQALSRSRCVVIESHLASCGFCSSQRDAIAALRDQTTLLLGALAPARRIPVSLEELERRRLVRKPRRQRTRLALWAASLVGALGLGYGLRSVGSAPHAPEVALAPVGNVTAEPQAADAPGSNARSVIPATTRVNHRGAARPVAIAVPVPAPGDFPLAHDGSAPPSAESSTSALPTDADPGLQGFWRTVPWDKAQDVAGKAPARIEGVPVEEVQVQPSRVGGSPMMVVAQRLSSGEVIQTIEGPTADVSQLLSRRGDGGLDSAGRPAEAMQRGDRMLVVTGELPSDSLRAMVRRVNAAMRVR
jgi:hypothetical protein